MHTHACTAVRVIVHYVAAERPFQDRDADPAETVGRLKARVLCAFGLTEGPTGDGNRIVYTLFEGRNPLENLVQSLGDLVGRDCGLQLKLVQQLIQG